MRRTILLLAAAFVLLAGPSPAAAQIPPSQADDALSSRLFLGSTGRALKRGEAYFAVDSVIFQTMQIHRSRTASLRFIKRS